MKLPLHACLFSLSVIVLASCSRQTPSAPGKSLRLAISADPKTLDPLSAAGEPAELIRYLTQEQLVRINRQTFEPEGELATGWQASSDGRELRFTLRSGLQFSDGTTFTAQDVVTTLERAVRPEQHTGLADTFRFSGAAAKASTPDPLTVVVRFPQPVANAERLFDSLPILSAAAGKEHVTLGPFTVASRQPGQSIRLVRNPRYWKRDVRGHALPYLEQMDILVQQNREIEWQQFERNSLDLVQSVSPEAFLALRTSAPQLARDAGASLVPELFWFNLNPRSSLPDYKKSWFQQRAFRAALALAISRPDLARVAYQGLAEPAYGLVPPANRLWHNASLPAVPTDRDGAARQLAALGFHKDGSVLKDSGGHPVEFSLITNAGNQPRLRLATLLQQDLAKLGIQVRITPLEFSSLGARLGGSDYDTCLLGFANVDPDPNWYQSILPSRAGLHAWNPEQPRPATLWEAEIDRLMERVAGTRDKAARKLAFDRVQAILAEELPVIPLVFPHVLTAVHSRVLHAQPVVLSPRLLWNREQLDLAAAP